MKSNTEAHQDKTKLLTGGYSNRKSLYEMQGRYSGIACGGAPAVFYHAQDLGLAKAIDDTVHVFKVRHEYKESDHVLNIAMNALCGGQTLDDMNLRRSDQAWLDAIGADKTPAPTTSGDFCRRFNENSIDNLQDAINKIRIRAWKKARITRDSACIDVDGVFVPSGAECAEGVAYNWHKKAWGYYPFIVSLANTQEVLFIKNRNGNTADPSGAPEYLDKSISLLKEAGFKNIIMRGDSAFYMTQYFDRWTDDNVGFVFGVDAMQNFKSIAESFLPKDYQEFLRRLRYAEAELEDREERQRQSRHKEQFVLQEGYRNLTLDREDTLEFEYSPSRCKKSYRIIVLRKLIRVEKGQELLLPEVRYFFYVTNRPELSIEQVIDHSNDRCNQENLNAQLKSGIPALKCRLNTFHANWACMIMMTLAWSMKAWFAMSFKMKEKTTKERASSVRNRLLSMEFRTFLNHVVNIPVLVVRTGRKVILRLLTSNPWTEILMKSEHFSAT